MEQEKNPDDQHLFITRTPYKRGLDGFFPPRDAETNPFYQAFVQAGMFDHAGSIDTPSAEHLFRDSIYPPGSEDATAPYKQRAVNAYRILQTHARRPACSVCFDEFVLDGGIEDTGSAYLCTRAPTPAVHFYHGAYHYEGIIFADAPHSKLYLGDDYITDTSEIVLKSAREHNPFSCGSVDFLVPKTGIFRLAPNIVIPGLSEIWISGSHHSKSNA